MIADCCRGSCFSQQLAASARARVSISICYSDKKEAMRIEEKVEKLTEDLDRSFLEIVYS